MKSVRTTLAYAAAIALVAFGLLALLNPLVAVRLVGLEVVEPRGLSEVRASYGALLLAFGGAMLWAIPTRPRSAPWLRFGGLLFLAAAAGRTASVLLDGVWTPLNLLIVALEAVVAAAFVLASFQTRPTGGAPRRDAELPVAADRASSTGTSSSGRRGLFGRRRARSSTTPDAGDDRADADDEPDPLRALRS